MAAQDWADHQGKGSHMVGCPRGVLTNNPRVPWGLSSFYIPWTWASFRDPSLCFLGVPECLSWLSLVFLDQ